MIVNRLGAVGAGKRVKVGKGSQERVLLRRGGAMCKRGEGRERGVRLLSKTASAGWFTETKAG